MITEEMFILSEIHTVKRFIAETLKENVIDIRSWENRLQKLNEELEQLRTKTDNSQQIKDKTDILHLYLTRKELGLIFKWYDKGYTHLDSDKPLLDKLQKIYQAELTMTNTVHCYNENEMCESCKKKPVQVIHKVDQVGDKLIRLCNTCFAEVAKE